MIADTASACAERSILDRLSHVDGHVWRSIENKPAKAWAQCAFPGRTRYGQIGQISFCRLSANAHRVEPRSHAIRPYDQQLIKLILQLDGESELEQAGKRVGLSQGEWSLYDPTRPYFIDNFGVVEQLVMVLPRTILWDHDLDMSRVTVQSFGEKPGIERIVTGFLTTMTDEIAGISLANHLELSETALHLLRLAVTEHQSMRRFYSSPNILRDRIKAYINHNLHASDLSMDQIANALGCTTRYLHKVFLNEEQTLGQYICSLRLERCHADLRNPTFRQKTVTEIAFSWGFNNVTHFSRVFRKKFSMAPTTCRNSTPFTVQ